MKILQLYRNSHVRDEDELERMKRRATQHEGLLDDDDGISTAAPCTTDLYDGLPTGTQGYKGVTYSKLGGLWDNGCLKLHVVNVILRLSL